ncbi:MAG: FHA domain-containing protein [Coriobacteriia bacterium]|nr:FHA domain-containing protein [Coriobacteriia bacterium]
MGKVLSQFENGVENAVDAAAGAVFKSPIEPAQIAKKAEKQMRQNRLVGSGRQYAPTLYNVLVNADDNKRLFGFYPTMAAEIETYLMAKGAHAGLDFDGRPLVRFIVDDGLKKGKFDVIAENVAAPVIRKLRDEEMQYYGLAPKGAPAGAAAVAAPMAAAVPAAPAVVPLDANLAPAAGALGALDNASGYYGDGLDVNADVSLEQAAEHALDDAQADGTLPSKGSSVLVDLKDNTRKPMGLRTMTVGRNPSNDIVLNDANASRVHAQFTQDITGTWKLTDLDSTNGTQLNDRPVKQAFLNDGDHITIGLTTYEFKA